MTSPLMEVCRAAVAANLDDARLPRVVAAGVPMAHQRGSVAIGLPIPPLIEPFHEHGKGSRVTLKFEPA